MCSRPAGELLLEDEKFNYTIILPPTQKARMKFEISFEGLFD